MDPYTPKTFAVGEILTAQDVNEHLVNSTRRVILKDAEVATGTDPVSVVAAEAIVDEDAAGNKVVTLWIRYTGLDVAAGPLNVQVATLSPYLQPISNERNLYGNRGNSDQSFTVQSNGSLSMRHSTASISGGTTGNITGSYPITA